MTPKDKAVREALEKLHSRAVLRLEQIEIQMKALGQSAPEAISEIRNYIICSHVAIFNAETHADTIKSPWFFADDGTLNQLAVISLPFQAKEAYDDLVKVRDALRIGKDAYEALYGQPTSITIDDPTEIDEALTILNRFLSEADKSGGV